MLYLVFLTSLQDFIVLVVVLVQFYVLDWDKPVGMSSP
jgi:hypothetical protein